MSRLARRYVVLIGMVSFFHGPPAQGVGDVSRGAQVARTCLACHSFNPGTNLTGSSLAGIFGRQAGTDGSFGRYSDALKRSGIAWDERSLDAWLADPAALVPGSSMDFAGIPDQRARSDLIAYLKAVSTGRQVPPDRRLPDLKDVEDTARVTAIRQCADAYRVGTADGKTRTFWEFNIRFKTDGSANGPAVGKPVIVGNGMRGDRAAVIFSRLDEISGFVERQCP